MDLKDIVAVTGLSGLYKSAAKRNDGMIITSLENGKTTFASARVHMFTPLDTITVYVENNDTTELIKILAEMKKQEKSNPLPDAKADNPTLKTYFKKILPNYDEEKVYFSDIIKIIKWYRLLDAKGLVDTKAEATKEETKDEEKHAADTKPKAGDAAPKKASTRKAASTKAPTGAKSTVQKLTNQSKRGG
jgi:spore coat protein CotF